MSSFIRTYQGRPLTDAEAFFAEQSHLPLLPALLALVSAANVTAVVCSLLIA